MFVTCHCWNALSTEGYSGRGGSIKAEGKEDKTSMKVYHHAVLEQKKFWP